MHELQDFRGMTDQDLAVLGLNDVAYIKGVLVDGKIAYAVHAADGARIAVMAERDVAFAAVRQGDMEPVSVH